MIWCKLLLIDTECLDNKKVVWDGFSDDRLDLGRQAAEGAPKIHERFRPLWVTGRSLGGDQHKLDFEGQTSMGAPKIASASSYHGLWGTSWEGMCHS